MSEDALSVLTRLLEAPPGAENVYLEKSRDFWEGDWTTEEMEAVEQSCRERYRGEAERLRAAWGTATFSGSWEDPDFPDWCPGTEVSYWEKGDRLAYLWWEHQDQELPFFLVAGAKTRQELEA